MIDCDHKWNSDKETRFCETCGQVRTFPTDGKSGKVVWQGLDDKRNPLELSTEEKSILAHLAQELGIRRINDCIKIEVKLLRAWVGAYCGDHRKPHKPKIQTSSKSSKSPKSPKSPLSTNVVKSDLKVDLPPFPPFNDKWDAPVQSEWLVTYLELAKLKEPTKSTNC